MTTTPGICGIIDAACFLKLGGVVAEIMDGNLMFAVPLVAFTLGATVGAFLMRWGADSALVTAAVL